MGSQSHSVRFLIAALVVNLAFCCLLGFAQQGTAALNGQVTDSSNLAVAGAKIVATNTDTNVTYTATTNEAGLYNLPTLPAGNYQITASKEGFQQLVKPGVELHVLDVIALNLALQIGSVTQTVTVESGAPLVETASSSLGGLVSDQKIADLPLNGRNYIDLSLLQAGVQQNTSSNIQIGGMSGTTYSVNGVSMISNNFLLDGTQIGNQSGWGTASFAGTTLGVDGIKEYKVLTSAFDASYGMAMGSQMVMISKGGTNQFHGDVFEYFRNSALNARNYFDGPTIPHLEKNNYGASFGGPIRKDKTFFFAVYEGLKQTLGFTAVDIVPAASCHGNAGNLIWNGQGVQPAGSIGPCPQLGSNPNLGLPAGPNNNYVTIVNSQIASMLALYPNPTVNSGSVVQFRFNPPTFVAANYGQMRFDHNFSPSDILFGRYTIDQSNNDAASNLGTPTVSGVAFPQFRGGGTTMDQFITASETHIFSPSVSNSARISFSRTGWNTFWTDTGTNLSAIPSFPGGPGFLPGVPFSGFGIGGGISAIGWGGNAGPLFHHTLHLQNIYSLADDVYYTRGKHQFRFGTLMNRFNQALTIVSTFSFGSPTYSNLATFLQGIPLNFQVYLPGGNDNRFFTYNTFGFYGQDDWHVNSRLTLNLGLRYEFLTTVREQNGKEFAVRDAASSAAWTQGPIMRDRSHYNFGPRVGFAWDIFGDGKTALRGGGGIYYDIGNFGGGMTGNAITALPNISLAITNPSNKVYTFPVTVPSVATVIANGTALTSAQDFDYNAINPFVYQYNLTLQRQLPKNTAVSVAFVGTQGEHLWQILEGNPITPTAVVNGVQYWSTTTPNCQGGTFSAVTGTFVQPTCRINPHFGTLGIDTSSGVSNYNALQVVVAKRLSRGLEAQAAYTLGHALSTATGQLNGINCVTGMDSPVSSNEKASDRGPACTDVRHNLRFNLLYHFPTLKSNGLLAKAANGWWMGNIVAVNTGFPFSPYISSNRSDSGNKSTGTDRPNFNTQAIAKGTSLTDASGNPYVAAADFVRYDPKTVIIGNPNEWFNPNMFSLQPFVPCPGSAGTCSTLGNVPRGLLRGPGLGSWDLSLVKDTSVPFLGEEGSVQFRAEFFNILNRPNFATPATAAIFSGGNTTSLAGAYSQAPSTTSAALTSTTTTSRQIQFAIKLIF
jgi:hypothetical protein